MEQVRRDHQSRGGPVAKSIVDGRRLVARLLRLIESRGGDVQAVLASKGGAEPLSLLLDDGMIHVPETTLLPLTARASVVLSDLQAQKTGRDRFRGSDWQILFYCLIGSRTLREAILRVQELFDSIDQRMGSLSLSCTGRRAHVTMGGASSGDDELDFTVSLHGLLMFHSIFAWLIGRPLRGTAALAFPHTARRYVEGEEWPFTLLFDVPLASLIFDAALLGQPVIRTIEDCEAMPNLIFLFSLHDKDDPIDVARKARTILTTALRKDRRMLSLDELATQVALSRMTLRRRLHASGTNFHLLRDEVRRAVALDLAANSRLSVEEMAHRLDFCDADSLRLAFHNWTGMAPTHYRRHLRSGSNGG